jgi:hypothetical protein
VSLSGVAYVFAYFRKGEARDCRIAELMARCLVARSKAGDDSDLVIGIGFCEFNPPIGSETDLVYMQVNASNDEWRVEAKKLRDELGYFKTPLMSHLEADEFPVN